MSPAACGGTNDMELVTTRTDTFRRQQNRRILWAVSYKRHGICHEQNPTVRV